MKPITAQQMKLLDRFTIQKIGIPALVLMENAGRAVFQRITENFGSVANKKILVFAGKGGNAGDALVVARYCARAGALIKIIMFASPQDLSAETAANFKIVQNLNLRIFQGLKKARQFLNEADFVIDGIFGFGFKGEATGIFGQAIQLINQARRQKNNLEIIAIDVPSGLNATSGNFSKNTIHADLTVTLGLAKTGLLKSKARKFVGQLAVVDIGLIEKKTFRKTAAGPDFLMEQEVAALLPRRDFDLHKTQAGKVLVIAGSKNMAGAAVLTSWSSLRSGAGIVYLAMPKSLQKEVRLKIPEVITFGISETKEKTFAEKGALEIFPLIKKCDALALGPGLTTHPQTQKFVLKILENWNKNFSKRPIVLDADSLNILALNQTQLKKFFARVKQKKTTVILTPHSGELSRLIKQPIKFIENNREKIVKKFSQKWAATIVLKGPRTVIGSPDGQVAINSTGSAVLATAGAGDVLTGIIAGLVAQGMAPFNAAKAGVFLHGKASEIAAQQIGPRGIIARDIVELLPTAYNKLQ